MCCMLILGDREVSLGSGLDCRSVTRISLVVEIVLGSVGAVSSPKGDCRSNKRLMVIVDRIYNS